MLTYWSSAVRLTPDGLCVAFAPWVWVPQRTPAAVCRALVEPWPGALATERRISCR